MKWKWIRDPLIIEGVRRVTVTKVVAQKTKR